MSALERMTDALARSIASWVVQRAHPMNREWALAMSAEMDSIDRPATRLRWAAGSLAMLRSSPPAGRPRLLGSLARNLLALAAFVAALRIGMALRIGEAEGWVVTSTVMAGATVLWWLVSLALRATVMSYASAGQAVFGSVTLAAHLTFGIKSVQGGEIYFAIMGAATLAAVCAGWLRSRGGTVGACLLVGLGAAVLNEALWIAPWGVGRFALVPNQVTIFAGALLGAMAGVANVARLGPDRPLAQATEA